MSDGTDQNLRVFTKDLLENYDSAICHHAQVTVYGRPGYFRYPSAIEVF